MKSDYDAEYFSKYGPITKEGTLMAKFLSVLNNILVANAVRKEFRLVAKYSPPTVLEVGSGLGRFGAFASARLKYFSIDIAELAEQREFRNFVRASAEAIPYRNHTFSTVVALDVIEHLSCPGLFLDDARAVLADGGFLILRTPNPDSVGRRLAPNDWFADRDATHVNVRPLDYWIRELEDRGFAVSIVFSEGLFFYSTRNFQSDSKASKLPMLLLGIISTALLLVGMTLRRRGENLWIVGCLSTRHLDGS